MAPLIQSCLKCFKFSSLLSPDYGQDFEHMKVGSSFFYHVYAGLQNDYNASLSVKKACPPRILYDLVLERYYHSSQHIIIFNAFRKELHQNFCRKHDNNADKTFFLIPAIKYCNHFNYSSKQLLGVLVCSIQTTSLTRVNLETSNRNTTCSGTGKMSKYLLPIHRMILMRAKLRGHSLHVTQ